LDHEGELAKETAHSNGCGVGGKVEGTTGNVTGRGSHCLRHLRLQAIRSSAQIRWREF